MPLTEERPKPKQGIDGRFVAGNSGNGGRSKGSRNRLSEAFIAALSEDFDKHGIAVIERVRTSEPGAYLRTIASLVPRQLEVEGDGAIQVVTKAQRDAAVKAAQRADE